MGVRCLERVALRRLAAAVLVALAWAFASPVAAHDIPADGRDSSASRPSRAARARGSFPPAPPVAEEDPLGELTSAQ
jgi:hypothetical protein